jgi:hypothetical protein
MRTRILVIALCTMIPALALASSVDLRQITGDLNRADWIVATSQKAGVLMQVQPKVSHMQAPAMGLYGIGRHAPICLAPERADGPLWIGVAHAARLRDGEAPEVYCFVNGADVGSDYPARARAFIQPPAGRPHGWIDWGVNRPPAASVHPPVLHTQANGRKLFACYAETTVAGRPAQVVGYVGDDNRCHGYALESIKAGDFSVGRGIGTRQSRLIKRFGARRGYNTYKLYAPLSFDQSA